MALTYTGTDNHRLAIVQPTDLAGLAEAGTELMDVTSPTTAVRVRNILDLDMIGEIEKGMRNVKLIDIGGVISRGDKQWPAVRASHQARRSSPDKYFARTRELLADDNFMAQLAPTSAPVVNIMDTLRRILNAELSPAKEGDQNLLPAKYTEVVCARAHRDVSAHEKQWKFSSHLRDDIAWTVPLTEPEKDGGKLLVYPRETAGLESLHNVHRTHVPLEIDHEPGDLILIPSAVAHAVRRTKSAGRRAISGCVAFEPEPSKTARYWA